MYSHLKWLRSHTGAHDWKIRRRFLSIQKEASFINLRHLVWGAPDRRSESQCCGEIERAEAIRERNVAAYESGWVKKIPKEAEIRCSLSGKWSTSGGRSK